MLQINSVTYAVRVEYGLFHNTHPKLRLGTVTVTIDGGRISPWAKLDLVAMESVHPGMAKEFHDQIVKDALHAVSQYKADPRYPIIWDENSCLECTVLEIPN